MIPSFWYGRDMTPTADSLTRDCDASRLCQTQPLATRGKTSQSHRRSAPACFLHARHRPSTCVIVSGRRSCGLTRSPSTPLGRAEMFDGARALATHVASPPGPTRDVHETVHDSARNGPCIRCSSQRRPQQCAARSPADASATMARSEGDRARAARALSSTRHSMPCTSCKACADER